MKKVLLLLPNGFEIYEASVFIDVIGWNATFGTKDTKLYTCSINKSVESTFGIKMEVDFIIDDINPNEFEALAIPGGFGQFGFLDNAYSNKFLDLIRIFNESKKTISSICLGALPLGKSGILKNRKATTYNLMGGRRQNELKDFGVNVINEPIVIDDNIITSWSPVTAIDVAFDLLERLTSSDNAKNIKKIMGFKID
jgi:4-methyl-5(b-hydroxyethyl)-thiazole monophosphate biosynthesis